MLEAKLLMTSPPVQQNCCRLTDDLSLSPPPKPQLGGLCVLKADYILFRMESILNFSLLKRSFRSNYNLCTSCLITPGHYPARLLGKSRYQDKQNFLGAHISDGRTSLPFCTQVCNFEIYIAKATAVQNIWKTSLPQSASRTMRKHATFSSTVCEFNRLCWSP